MNRENISLHKSKKYQIDFAVIFRYCWKVLELYGRKEEDYKGIYSLFLNILKDLPGKKVNKAFEDYLKNNEKFPTPAAIRKLAQSYDDELTEKEVEFRKMYRIAFTRETGYMDMTQLSILDKYEEEYSKITISKNQNWTEEYDRIFNNMKLRIVK